MGTFVVYALTMARNWISTDVFGSAWTSWHLAKSGSPWIDDNWIPQVAHAGQSFAIVTTDNGHTAFGRFPGTVVAALPAYLLAGPRSMTIVPASLTAAFLTTVALALLFNSLRRRVGDLHAMIATGLLGFGTPVWTIPATTMWPHTITVLGIAGMAWASASDRWWWVGVFGGVTLWGRVHAALIVGVLGLGVAITRRDPRMLLRVGLPSAAFLLASCGWTRWMYGSWSPFGAYDAQTVHENAEHYRLSVLNQLGMWISPDRGILIWTPLVTLLLPALLRSWPTLPNWSRSLLLGGLAYTVLGGTLNTFTGGGFFYGYRYGLEMLVCATPALVFSRPRMGRVARACFGPVAAIQILAFFLGATRVTTGLPQAEAWRHNSFVAAVDTFGLAGWLLVVLVALSGALVARVLSTAPSVGATEPVELPGTYESVATAQDEQRPPSRRHTAEAQVEST